MRTYSSHRLPPAGQHDEGSVGNRAQGAQGDRRVEARTRVTPWSLSSQALITTSSPPCPRRVTKFGPDFSRNAAELGTRSAKNCCARATTSADESETVVVWIMESAES